MKRYLVYLAIVAIVALIPSCLNTLEPPSVGSANELNLTDEEAIAAAKAYYDEQVSRIVGGEGNQPMWPWQAKPHAPYDLGEYEIVWESGYVKNYPGKIHVDFDIIKEHDFIYFPDTCDHFSGMKLRSRFVSVQTPDTTIQYIATYIPHEAYYDRYYSVRHGGGSIGLLEVNFSGRVLHSTLDGYHYATHRVWQGEITKKIELYNAPLMTMQQRYEEFFNIMENYHVGVCKLADALDDDINLEVEIEEVVVIYEPQPKPKKVQRGTIYKYTPDLSSMDEYVKFYKPIGGGGGGSSNTEEDDIPTNTIDGKTPEEVCEDIFNNYGNLADSVKTKVNTMIAEIAEDCMGKELLSQLMEKNRSIGISYDPNTPISNHQYNPDTQTHNITLKKVESEVFLHELFHAYQHTTNTVGSANIEIEAQYAKYLYMFSHENSGVLARFGIFIDGGMGEHIINLSESMEDTSADRESNIQITLAKFRDYMNEILSKINEKLKKQNKDPLPLYELIQQSSNTTFKNISEKPRE